MNGSASIHVAEMFPPIFHSLNSFKEAAVLHLTGVDSSVSLKKGHGRWHRFAFKNAFGIVNNLSFEINQLEIILSTNYTLFLKKIIIHEKRGKFPVGKNVGHVLLSH
jgi:hypothetical protein